MIRIAHPRLFLVVARAQCGIKGCDRLFNRRPFRLTVLIFGYARLQTSLVLIRARIAHVLIAIRLGEENAQADATRHFGICGIEALGSSDSGSQLDNVVKWSIRVLRVGGRRLHDAEEIGILVEKRLIVGIEIRRWNSEFIASSDFGWLRVGEILI